ncbi:hypothetical protein [Streptomyces sp. cmx-18-6]|uniref:hypothetical protein n=1 Tax=Streptomyces sp. cmx-18-6 TaxID=2790930 RepID=UPI00398095BE
MSTSDQDQARDQHQDRHEGEPSGRTGGSEAPIAEAAGAEPEAGTGAGPDAGTDEQERQEKQGAREERAARGAEAVEGAEGADGPEAAEGPKVADSPEDEDRAKSARTLTPRQARRLRVVLSSVGMVAMGVVLALRIASRSSVLVVGVYGLALILCGLVIELSRNGRTRLGSWLLGLGLVAAVGADWLLLP